MNARGRDAPAILVVSTPVGPIGSGVGGGVELTIANLVGGLVGRGHAVEVVAPFGSRDLGVPMHLVDGAPQISSQLTGRDAPVVMPTDSVLAAMWSTVADLIARFDVVVNLAYDWLPLYLTSLLPVPVCHLVSMGSLSDAMDHQLRVVARRHPGRLAAHSAAQVATFGDIAMRVVGNGIDVDRHAFRARASEPPTLGWIGRISPEKGLADAAQVAARTGLPLAVWGYLQDADHFAEVVAAHPRARIEHRGFLATADLHRAIGGCAAILVTPAWDEAFGNVAVEAMAAGVPVLAYDRGGPGEIVVDGVTGYVVPAGDLDALADAVGRIDRIDRAACRRHAESEYSIAAMAARVERWLLDVVDD